MSSEYSLFAVSGWKYKNYARQICRTCGRLHTNTQTPWQANNLAKILMHDDKLWFLHARRFVSVEMIVKTRRIEVWLQVAQKGWVWSQSWQVTLDVGETTPSFKIELWSEYDNTIAILSIGKNCIKSCSVFSFDSSYIMLCHYSPFIKIEQVAFKFSWAQWKGAWDAWSQWISGNLGQLIKA